MYIWCVYRCWCSAKSKARVKLIQKTGHLMYMQRHRDISIKQLKDNTMVMKWLNNNKDIKLMFVLFIVFLVGMTSYTIGHVRGSDYATKAAITMYEDEMIVPIDDFTALQEAVVTLQAGMELLLAGEPQSPGTPPSLTTEQEQFMCIQNTEDYKDGFLEISTILACMNLQLTE